MRANRPLRNAQLAVAGTRTVDLAQLVVVSAWLFTRGGAADVALFGIVRTLVPAVGVAGSHRSRVPRRARCSAPHHVSARGRRVLDHGNDRRQRRADARRAGVRRHRRAGPRLLSAGGQRAGAQLVGSPGELISANAANGIVEGASSLVGPVVGSVVAAVLGVCPLLVITGAGMLWVGAVAGRLPKGAERQAAAGRSRFADYVAGGRRARGQPTRPTGHAAGHRPDLRPGAMSVIVVAFAIDVLRSGDAGVGLLYGAIGVGGLVGLPVAVLVIDRTGVHRSLVTGLIMWGLPLALSALAPAPIVALAMFGVIGLGNSVVDISYFAVLQRSVDQGAGQGPRPRRGDVRTGLAAGASVVRSSSTSRCTACPAGHRPGACPGAGSDGEPPAGRTHQILGRRTTIDRMREQADHGSPADRRPRSPRHRSSSLTDSGSFFGVLERGVEDHLGVELEPVSELTAMEDTSAHA